MEFEWDPDKAARNLAKHGVSFDDAATIFGNPLAMTYFDPDHSEDEDRFLTFGLTQSGKWWLCLTLIGEDRIRVISPRPTSAGLTMIEA